MEKVFVKVDYQVLTGGAIARAFLPAIQDFYASEEGQKVKERLDRERAEKEALKKK